MNNNSERNFEAEKEDLLSKYSDAELLLFQDILKESSFLVNDMIITVENRSEVGTDGEQK